MIVGQVEIRGEIWLTLDCGHQVRRDAFDGFCARCRVNEPEDKPKKKPRPRRRGKKKPDKAQYAPYTGADSRPAPQAKQYKRFAFEWRGKMRY